MSGMQNTPTDLKTRDSLRRVQTPYIYISFVLSPVSDVLKIPVYKTLKSHCHYITVRSHDNHMIKIAIVWLLSLKRYLQSTALTARCVTKATCAFIFQWLEHWQLDPGF